MNKWHKRVVGIPWVYKLAAICTLGFLVNSVIFYPGFASGDVIVQLYQAQGDEQLTNLHPIYVAMLWKALIKITGYVSSLMLLNLAMLWGAVFFLGWYIHRKTGSVKRSLLALALPILPYVINISGVMWKDVHLSFLLLFATVLSLFSLTNTMARYRYLLTAIALVALIAAVLTRYNAIPAIAPVFFLTVYNSGVFANRRVMKSIAVSTLLMVVSVGMMVGLGKMVAVVDKTPMNGPKLDDIVNVSDRSLIEDASDGDGEAFLLGIYDCSEQKGIKLDVIHNCAARSSAAFDVSQPYTASIESVWRDVVIKKPIRHFEYKIHQYVAFLFPPPNAGYVWHEGVDSNTYIADNEPFPGKTLGIVVKNFWHKYFSFLYEPWFWMITTIILFVQALRKRDMPLRTTIISLAVSSLLLLLSYAPTGATIDYRYVYWSAISCSLGVILLITLGYLRLPLIEVQYKYAGQNKANTNGFHKRKALSKKESRK